MPLQSWKSVIGQSLFYTTIFVGSNLSFFELGRYHERTQNSYNKKNH